MLPSILLPDTVSCGLVYASLEQVIFFNNLDAVVLVKLIIVHHVNGLAGLRLKICRLLNVNLWKVLSGILI